MKPLLGYELYVLLEISLLLELPSKLELFDARCKELSLTRRAWYTARLMGHL